MAQITNYNSLKYQSLSDNHFSDSQELTLRDKVLKELSKKQLKTSVTLHEAKNAREFSKSSIQESGPIKKGGLFSLAEFKNVSENAETRDFLRNCDLSNDDIELLMTPNNKRHENPDYKRSKLEYIESQLDKRLNELTKIEPETFSDAVGLPRDELVAELRKPTLNTHAENLSACLVRPMTDKDLPYPANHPIHRLPQLVKDLFPNTENHTQLKRLRKRTKKKLPVFKSCETTSQWDVTMLSQSVAVPSVESVKSESQRIPINIDKIDDNTDYSKPFVWPSSYVVLKKFDELKSNCLSLDNLKSMEKFRKYEPGKPSLTLYVKNLNCNAEELVSVFGNFEKKVFLVYRLLKGKMKGQAFIRFPNCRDAEQALLHCNGYLLNEKPMVVAFGKK